MISFKAAQMNERINTISYKNCGWKIASPMFTAADLLALVITS